MKLDWTWFSQLYSMSASFLIIGVVWKIVIIPLALGSLLFNNLIQKIYMSIITLIPNYFMASYAALLTIGINDGEKSLFLSIVGGLFLVTWLLMGVAQADKEMRKDFNYENEYLLTVRSWGTLLTLIYYIYCLFNLMPAVNKITVSLYDLMIWIQNIKVVGLVVSVCAFLSAIYVIIIGTIALIGMIFSLIPEKKKSRNL